MDCEPTATRVPGLVLHLAAVILAPLAFATRPSPAIGPMLQLAEPYIDAAHMNHGYAFFAPIRLAPAVCCDTELSLTTGESRLQACFPIAASIGRDCSTIGILC